MTWKILDIKKGDGSKEKDKERDNAKEKDNKKENYERYLRIWKLMEMLLREQIVDRRQLVGRVFHDNPKELDIYLAAGIIRYIIKGNLQAKGAYETPHKQHDEHVLPVREQVFVAAGVPRLRMAFAQILADPQMQEQCAGVERFLKKQKLKDKEKELVDRRKELYEEMLKNSERMEQMIVHSAHWKEVLGVIEFSKRMQLVITKETHINNIMCGIEENLSNIREELLT